ncbi:Pre-C2HC domain,Zinc finger, CCHC-type [Cinara cedri]|uniref:Pre-C2HC domain,Zinc finger, CCHC-type n=1 Tax=Cinara cedri TaxID=506608 RepID=A0A5E4NH23_9HEMI|nr:Pre-C2HC domain,Zinc finger, CCHC-type [Cinara cedri]
MLLVPQMMRQLQLIIQIKILLSLQKLKEFTLHHLKPHYAEPDLNSSSHQPMEQNNDNSDEVFKPPPLPIFVRGVENYLDLCTALIELIDVDNFFCKAFANCLKIQTSNLESYRALIHFLKDQEAEFNTYRLKQGKPLRIVIRNLHPTTKVDTIKEELEVRLFEIRRVTNVLHKVTKIPLPLFFVDLEPTIRSTEIFNLSSLLHTKIKVEEPYKSKTISQCNNCQEYGHTKTYCGYPTRCVHYGSNHKSSDCPNQRSVPPKCALCAGDHPASYKGCSIYKDLQRAKKPFIKSNFVPTNNRVNTITVSDNHPVNDTHPIQPDPRSYVQVISGRTANDLTPPITPDLNTTITNFLEDFKSLINPLMSLLTKVIEKLLAK